MWWGVIAAAVSHFSMIGYPVATSGPEGLDKDIQAYAEGCELIPLQEAHHVCIVGDASGAELWIGVDDKPGGPQEVRTLNPALRGKGRTAVVVTGSASDPAWRPFETTVQADFAHARTPLVFDLADPREASRFVAGAKLDLDLTAFADEIAVHPSESAYYVSQHDAKIRFASKHFVPSGMFTDGGDGGGPSAHALFAGKILQSELRRNSRTNAQYWWILVQTYDDAVMNVVAAPSQVNGSPPAGGIVSGSFWLSARIAPPAPAISKN